MNTFSFPKVNNHHLAAFLPITHQGHPLAILIENAASALLAVHHFNNRMSDVVKLPEKGCGDLKFTIEIIDTQISAKATLKGFSDLIARRQQKQKNDKIHQTNKDERPFPTALIGATTSQVSSPLAKLSGIFGIPQISHAATSSMLDNKDQYPLFGRLLPPVSGDADAAISYFSDVLGVTHLFILFVRDEYGLSNAQAMKIAGLSKGMSIDSASFPFHADQQGISDVVLQLKRSGYRYCYGIFAQKNLIPVMTEAYQNGVTGPGYFWAFADGVHAISSLKLRSKSDSSLIEALSGTAQITLADPSEILRKERVSSFVQILKETFGKASPAGRSYFESNMPKELRAINNGTFLENFQFSEHIHPFSFTAYESVMTLAFAACDAQSNVGVNFTGFDLYDSFLRTELDGLYGKISIDPKTGSRLSHTVPYSLSNIVARPPTNNNNGDNSDYDEDVTFELISTHLYGMNAEDGESTNQSAVIDVEWKEIPGREFVYSDGTLEPPGSLPPLIEDKNLITTSVLVFGLTLCCITLLLSLWFGFWTVYRKESKVVKASQPIFLVMLCLGTFIMGSCIIPMSLQEPFTQTSLDVACTSTIWLLSIGFVVAFSALMSKTMRINKIFFTKGYKRVTVKPQHVLWPFLLLFTANTTVLVLWTMASPVKYHREMKNSTDKFGRHTESFGRCYQMADAGKFDTTYFSLLIGVNLLFLLYANYQAYIGRDIELQYSESRYIGLSMTLILQASSVGMPTLFLVHESPSASFLVASFLVTLLCVAILIPIIFPKMIFFNQMQIAENKRKEGRDLHRRKTNILRYQMSNIRLLSVGENYEDGRLGIMDRLEQEEEEEEGLAILKQNEIFLFNRHSTMIVELDCLNEKNLILQQQCERKKKVLSVINESMSKSGDS